MLFTRVCDKNACDMKLEVTKRCVASVTDKARLLFSLYKCDAHQ